jgi:hypothetical protein
MILKYITPDIHEVASMRLVSLPGTSRPAHLPTRYAFHPETK